MSLEMIEERPPDRGMILRNAIIYAPTAAIVVTLFGMSATALFLQGRFGALLPGLILGAVSFAVVWELQAAIRDLRSEPVTADGEITRIWKKSRWLFFGRQDYLLMDRKVFEIGALAATELQEGEQVSIKHWPHTMRVVTVERVRGAEPKPQRR